MSMNVTEAALVRVGELEASLAASEARVRELLDYARHTHEARYFKDESGKMRLTDSCGKCGLDLRHEIHAAPPAPSAPKAEERPKEYVLGIDPVTVGGDVDATVYGYRRENGSLCVTRIERGDSLTPPRPDAKPEAGKP